jgi:hypothetical protein
VEYSRTCFRSHAAAVRLLPLGLSIMKSWEASARADWLRLSAPTLVCYLAALVELSYCFWAGRSILMMCADMADMPCFLASPAALPLAQPLVPPVVLAATASAARRHAFAAGCCCCNGWLGQQHCCCRYLPSGWRDCCPDSSSRRDGRLSTGCAIKAGKFLSHSWGSVC